MAGYGAAKSCVLSFTRIAWYDPRHRPSVYLRCPLRHQHLILSTWSANQTRRWRHTPPILPAQVVDYSAPRARPQNPPARAVSWGAETDHGAWRPLLSEGATAGRLPVGDLSNFITRISCSPNINRGSEAGRRRQSLLRFSSPRLWRPSLGPSVCAFAGLARRLLPQ